ncbi:MAG: nickel pincer cofactor biosynthesis protein LarB [Eggerthellaceae bacterium]|nr:nickel pincer cofactor biosynthesis protein LarB [Eggerthellaceae bacterium]
MELLELEVLINAVAEGSVAPDEALSRLRSAPFTDLGYAKIDNHRGIRQGVAEVIYGEGKTAEHIVGICQSMLKEGQQRILITRLAKEVAEVVAQELNATGVQDATQDAAGARDATHGARDAAQGAMFTYHELCRVGIVGNFPEPNGNGVVVIAAAGTSDLPVAEEAALTAEVLGNQVVRLYDVGVAGIHRLLAHTEDILNASVIVAVAGMEGALPSVVAGMASVPVIAVPTSVGYGASFKGIAALLAMLNSCASGVSVVNIDNGFGAGYQASLINHSKI